MTIMNRLFGREDHADIETRISVSKTEDAKKEDVVTIESKIDFDLDQDFGQVSAKELREFLSADLLDVKADPSFKKGLRRRLWAFVSHHYGRDYFGPSGSGPSGSDSGSED